ncbi:hypothetical protein AZE42_04951 [Rhizopogon vesiculosus]|uniref:Uncharacterized protein n=1 Tax=Rhizopogon vesiculosus TaxID=180088 RepID=A0A1J8QGT9_9AGAM|nr:hypothetical protein AZE42_04951 [Rhizopogon vesiculosus]
MFQGIQRPPDGASPPVGTPVNAAQAVNNANPNQSRSPLPTNDPFVNTTPVGDRFDHSALEWDHKSDASRSQFESSPFSELGLRGRSIPPAMPMIKPHERLGTMATANTAKSIARKKNIKSAPGIETVVQRVWDNETVRERILFLTRIRQSFRNDPKKKPKKKYEDYDRVFISTMAKSY